MSQAASSRSTFHLSVSNKEGLFTDRLPMLYSDSLAHPRNPQKRSVHPMIKRDSKGVIQSQILCEIRRSGLNGWRGCGRERDFHIRRQK
jgi:hypothetical protein